MKKKHLAIIAMLFAISVSAFAQWGVSTGTSLSMEKFGYGLKDRLGETLKLSYYFTNGNGLALQFRNHELWRYGDDFSNLVPLRTFSIKGFVGQGPEEELTKWYFAHQAGLQIAIGSPIHHQDPSRQLLKRPYFFGVFLNFGVGVKLSKNISLVVSMETEGILGMLRCRANTSENGSANGFWSLNTALKMKL